MWFIKKTAAQVARISKQALKVETPAAKLIADIISSRHAVMPTRQLSDLALLSFQIEYFQQILEAVAERLQEIKMQKKSLKKRLNTLVLVTYLIKHGASGFIDEFRTEGPLFFKYETLGQTACEEELRPIVDEIRERAKYIRKLLNDKTVLMREKEVARLVREKLALAGGDYSASALKDSMERPKSAAEKLEDFLDHYVWRYTQKLDCKLDEITDKLIAKIDEYIDGEIPESFDIEELEESNQKASKTEFQLGAQLVKQEELVFIKEKLPSSDSSASSSQPSPVNEDLLELPPARQVDADLLEFEALVGAVALMDDDSIESFKRELES